jgi:YVTN family beta-propeller protein
MQRFAVARLGVAVISLLVGFATPAVAKKAPAPPVPSLAVVATMPVGFHPFGVAVQSARAEAVVANREAGTVSIVDLARGTVIRTVPVGQGPRDVAVHEGADVALITLTAERALAVLDLGTGRVLKRIALADKPSGVAIDPALQLAVVGQQNGRAVSLVDLRLYAVVAEIAVGKQPMAVAINPLTHVAAVANRGDGTVTLIDLGDPANPTIPGVITLPRSRHHHLAHDVGRASGGGHGDDAPRARPVGIAFDHGPAVNRLVVADAGASAVHVLTLDAGSALRDVRSLDVGRRPFAVAVNPGQDFALVTSGRDDVLALTLDTPAVVARADVGRHPRGVAIDPVTCRAAVSNRASRTVSVLSTVCPPRLTALAPPSAGVSTTFTLTLIGVGFGADARVNFGTASRLTPAAVTPESIRIDVTTPATPASVPVSVTTGGRTTNTLLLRVTPSAPPVLARVSPATSTADGLALRLVLEGQRFAPAARVLVGGREVPRTAVTGCAAPTCVAATVPGHDVNGTPLERAGLTASGGSLTVQVENPDGGLSNVLPLVLLNPTPSLSSLVPNTATQGTMDKVVTVFGEGFVARVVDGQLVAVSQVLFDGVPVPAVPYAPNPMRQLFVTLPAGVIQTPGVYQVEVLNPRPGGGIALAQPFEVHRNVLPAGVVPKTIAMPEGSPGNVVAFAHGTRTLAAAGLHDAGMLRLLDVTDPLAPSLLGAGVTLAAGGYNSVADLGVNAATGTIVVALPQSDEVALVDVGPAGVGDVRRIGLPAGTFPFGVAVDAANDRAVVTGLGTLTLSVVDTRTASLTATIALPEDVESPIAVALEPATGIAAVIDQAADGGTLYLIDLVSGLVRASLSVGAGPSSVALDAGLGRVVVTNQDENEIAIVDVANPALPVVVAILPAGEQPSGIAIDPVRHRALVSNLQNNEVTVVDLDKAVVLGRWAIGLESVETPVDIAWQPGPTLGVAVMGSLIGNNVTIMAVPGAAVP